MSHQQTLTKPSFSMQRLRRSRLVIAWGVFGSATTLQVATLVLLMLSRATTTANAWSPFLIALFFPVLSLLVTLRQPDNLVGWLFSALGMSITLLGCSAAYALYGLPTSLSGSVAMAWLAGWLWCIILGLIPLLILVFPTGHLVTPRWQVVIWVVVANSILFLGFGAIIPGGLYAFPAVRNPLAFSNSTMIATGFVLTQAVQLILVLVAVFSLFLRFHRATRDERQQIKWIVSAFAFNVLLLLIDNWIPPGIWGKNIDSIGGMVLPIAIGAAILRYRLWDIDIIINRTLVYGALTTSVIALYILVVGSIGAIFHIGNNVFISLVATGLVAVLFQPERDWLQRGVNRLLYGQRDEPATVILRLGQQLEQAGNPAILLPGVVQILANALKLPYAAIALHDDATETIVAATGEKHGFLVRFPLYYQAESVGTLLVALRRGEDAFNPADQRLLTLVAQQAGMAVASLRLTISLQRANADLQQAREHLVTAREEERRRLRRDLHDGLGPQLSSQTLLLTTARMVLREHPEELESILSDAITQSQQAVSDIRRLVYALRPPALDDLGLVAALQEQLASYRASGINFTLDAPEQAPPLPAAVEVACYRIVQEAITNVVRHAHAHTCRISLLVEDTVYMEICDDGMGIPQSARSGVGMISMRERAEEVGGSWQIGPGTHGGTCIRVQLPLQ